MVKVVYNLYVLSSFSNTLSLIFCKFFKKLYQIISLLYQRFLLGKILLINFKIIIFFTKISFMRNIFYKPSFIKLTSILLVKAHIVLTCWYTFMNLPLCAVCKIELFCLITDCLICVYHKIYIFFSSKWILTVLKLMVCA